jgi:DNA repair protein RecO (recombination protein O)
VPVYRDEAVVLRTHKLGEADRIVTLLTRRHGKVRAVAKGVRRTGSKFGARLEPFMVADLQLYEGRSLDIVTQAESLGSYGAEITQDYASYTAANAMVEAADKLTEDEGSLQHTAVVVQLGGVVCDDCAPPGTPRIARTTVALLGALLAGDWAYAEASAPGDRNQASGIVAAYTQWHLERGLRSLPHVSRETTTT